MKIGKRALLVLGAVVIAAAIVVVGMLYFRQAGERAALSERLDRAETLLAGITRNRSDLEDQLASAQSSLETNRAKFPESVQSIEYGEYLFEIADACNVALDNLVFPTSATRTVGGVTYSVISLSLPISGTLEDIFKFIDTIRTDDRFASTDVKSINMNTGDSTTISMDIYGYEG
jgi:regulator of protease activity HflC (stomatin/prohibitin superfamily)